MGPGLDSFGVPGTLADPMLVVYDAKGAAVASNDNWNGADSVVAAQVGAFPLTAGSRDAVVVTTLPAGSYSAHVSGLGPVGTGVAILEIYAVSGSGQFVNIATRLPVGTDADIAVAGFVVSPGAGTRKLLVRGIGPALGAFGVPGTLPDPKLVLMDGNQNVLGTAVANSSAAILSNAFVQAGAFATAASDAAVIITAAPGNYTVQLAGSSGTTTGVALVEVYDITDAGGVPPGFGLAPRLYLASLRPATSATASLASGYATVLFDPNTNTGSLSVSFSNLTSAQVSGHLVLGSPASGAFVHGFSRGQVSGAPWAFAGSGPYSSNDVVAAMLTGQITVQIDSANFPGGELVGSFIQSAGSQTFVAPGAPPALASSALSAPSQTDAARFLTQATFGPTTAEIISIMARGFTNWINDQMALPASAHLAALREDMAAFPNPPAPPALRDYKATMQNRQAAWWKIVLTGPDQLRQRVAFALSEIFVVSDAGCELRWEGQGNARYYDLLVNGAFGNFRTLLENVTLSPIMGTYLSHLGNLKADPATGTLPDENYAREVQQLFTIGLVQLQPDGTLLLDAAGQPIPAYNQAMVTETAKILTGWSLPGYIGGNFRFSLDTATTVVTDTNGWLTPMTYYEAFHDKTEKRIVSVQQKSPASAAATVVAAGQTGPQDLKILLDTLFNHPNTGPFISRQLIQRLVTSNPSPGYVYRVASVFTNDGTGVRGNLGAVVRAILTDYEARSPTVGTNIGYGKIKEPLLRLTALLRVLNARAPNGRFMDSYFYPDPAQPNSWEADGVLARPADWLAQGALQAPSVFNFFSPDYSSPGPLAAAGMVAPELQITDATSAIGFPNAVTQLFYRPLPTTGPTTGLFGRPITAPTPWPFLVMDYSTLTPLLATTPQLLDQMSLLFCANGMSAATRSRITTALQVLVANTDDSERVKTALYLTVVSPDAALQK
ncbi:MAG: DUF1800 family protein [Opitutaceae bacterium]|nr:DUF1800 family protein [Opitutaceae bacterium]